jgi:histone H3/H4
MLFDLNKWVTCVDPLDYEQSNTHLLFDWATTTRMLKASNPNIKVSHKAKETFAFTMSSFADNVMEYMLKKKRRKCVRSIDIRDAFSHFNEPIGSFELIRSKPVSLQRIMAKFEALYKFKISYNASRLFACLLTSFMIDIAKEIHMNRKPDMNSIQIDEVHRVTDPIVYRRTYTYSVLYTRNDARTQARF